MELCSEINVWLCSGLGLLFFRCASPVSLSLHLAVFFFFFTYRKVGILVVCLAAVKKLMSHLNLLSSNLSLDR